MADTTTIATQGHFGTVTDRIVAIATQGHFLALIIIPLSAVTLESATVVQPGIASSVTQPGVTISVTQPTITITEKNDIT